MHRRNGIVCVLGAALVLSGCMTHARTSTRSAPPAEDPPAEAPPTDASAIPRIDTSVEHLLAYAAKARGLAPAAMRGEYLRAQEQHRREPNAFTRMKLAALVSARQAPFRDDLQARELLARAADESEQGTAAHSLAVWWLRQLDDRISLERALGDERRQRQTLQRQLEQLKSIEQEIDRRPATPVVPVR